MGGGRVDVFYDPDKEAANRRKHGLSLEVARYIFDDPLAAIAYDRFEGGEHRFHAIGRVAGRYLVLVHSYPDPEDDGCIRAISLREASAAERRRYERGDFA